MKSTQSEWKDFYQKLPFRTRLHAALLGWLPKHIQDKIGMLRRYKFGGHKGEGTPIVAVIDGSTFHGGLTDRWKGIVSLYAFSKATGREFKIHYVYPFDLADFQVPSSYNWIITSRQFSQNIFSVKMFRLTGETTISMLQNLPEDKQIHIYFNRDCIDLINKTYHTQYSWGTLFHELFKPSPLLQQAINDHLDNTKEDYIAVAFRMQNLLGDYPEYAYQPTDEQRQKEIIDSCLHCIELLHQKHKTRILVTSDSNLMTENATKMPYVWTNSGKAVHVDTVSSAPEEYYLKSFVDFYLLAGAQKVYAAATPEMYNSDFPKYAALTGNIPFERIFL